MSVDQTTEQLEHIRVFEGGLGVPAGFFERLMYEDDWSFLIKLHALVEAASTTLLVEALSRPELRDQLARLPLSDAECGKLALMKSLGIVSAPYRGFIRKLSELRNQAVHNVRHTNLSFRTLVSEIPKAKRAALAETLGVGVRATSQERLRVFEENPKGTIWISALCLISLFAVHKLRFETRNNISRLGQEALEFVERLGTEPFFQVDKPPAIAEVKR
jgi:hypothetical protein